MEFTDGDDDFFAHTPVLVNSEHAQRGAAIGSSSAAGNTMAAVEIGLHRAPIPDLQGGGGFAQLDDFNAQLMAQDSWVGEERLPAMERMNVSPANPDSPHPNAGLARLKRGDGIGRKSGEPTRFFEANRFH